MAASNFGGSLLAGARGVAVLLVLTLVGSLLHLGLATTSFLFLIAIVINSVHGSFRSAVAVCLAGVLLLDYFFTEPLFSFRVDDPFTMIALCAFAVSSLVVTRLSARARREAEQANKRRENMQKLYVLAQRLLELPPSAPSVAEPYVTVLGATSVCVFEARSSSVFSAGTPNPALEERTRNAYIFDSDFDSADLDGADSGDAGMRFTIRCLRPGGLLTGALGFQGLRDPEDMADSLAALAAGFLDRSAHLERSRMAAHRAEAESMRGAVLDALAHEFKTPLATMLTCADGLLESRPLSPAQATFAELIEAETSRLSSLTSRLLRVARLDAEDVRPHLDQVDLDVLIRALIDREARDFPAVSFVFEPCATPCEVVADPELIALATGQLLENAAKHSIPGEPVTIGVSREGRMNHVSVWSAGRPIAPENRTKIFERFRGSSNGSGLGLYVALKIARAHGGDLRLDSSVLESGNRFTLILPAMESEL